MSDIVAARSGSRRIIVRQPSTWSKDYYLRKAALADLGCGVLAVLGVLLAVKLRFGSAVTPAYMVLSVALPLLWIIALWLAGGGYDPCFIETGSGEFRKALNAAVSLTAALAIFSCAINIELSGAYVVLVLPSVTIFDLGALYTIRKRLHKSRESGRDLLNVVAVGHELAVAALVCELRRERYHGMTVVGACVAHPGEDDVAGVPVYGGLDDVTYAVEASGADTVAVLACPEMDGLRLRRLAWELEKTGTDLCVSPALLDVAGPRTTIRPAAGLTLLHVDHPQLTRFRLVIKGLFDRCVAAVAPVVLAPFMLALAAMIWLQDGGPALFIQTRVGKDGPPFKIYKFRTMVVDAEQRMAELLAINDLDGVLFKLREDPRVTRIGTCLRRWSSDELPQLVNVLFRHMSLVGPRPALPAEAAKYADHVRRRLVVKPGLTGLWQVNGRSDLSWEEVGPARPAIRRELVVRPRPAGAVEDDFRAGEWVGGLLTPS